jgi:enamine deaminase RidA (YjgF/YER057c/UK114 family)
MIGRVRHLNPEGLHRNPAYSQAVVVSGNVKTVYVGGQNGVDAFGNVVGRADIGAQSERAFRNLEIALAAGGAKAGLAHPEFLVEIDAIAVVPEE